MSTGVKYAKEWSIDIGYYVVGCTLMAVSTQVFDAPNNIAPGGVTGLSILINYLTDLPISMVSLAINIPLLVLAFFFLGKYFTLKTLTTVGISTLMIELVGRVVPAYHGETILAALYGGVLTGAGLAIVFMRASTTGGVDIIMRLIQLRRPDYSPGKLILFLDFLVLLTAVVVYRNVESALFALISLFTCSRIIDSILYGLDTGKMLMIISQKNQEISDSIVRELDRGCTLLSAKGGYTGQERPVLVCAVRKNQYYLLKKLVHNIDASAFLVALEATEVIGEGFKAPEHKR